ncbi:SDR family NAD(P)-dependent oxidoreductase [Thalassiella azotivora]
MTRRPAVVLVTGAGSGIGRATALRLAGRGDHVVLLSRAAGPLTEVRRACTDAGAASVHVVVADVADDDAVRRAVREVVAEHGRLDGVVHAAGVVAYGRVEDVPPHVLERVHRTNVLGSVTVVRHVLPVLREQRRGSVVLVGSLLGSIVAPGMGAYVTTKWAVRGLARQVQVENRDVPGVGVTHLAPGGVDTPIYRQAANVLGVVGRPPPPVSSPERVAAEAVRALDRPRRHVRVGPTSLLTEVGFTALPWLFDALVGPLFAVAAQDPRERAGGEGNVLTPQPGLEGLRGGQGSAWVSIATTLRDRAVQVLKG